MQFRASSSLACALLIWRRTPLTQNSENPQSGRTFLRYDDGKCLHYYFYFIDEDLGLCYVRVPTWCPFRLQFYCNGHNWLARQLDRKKIGYTQVDNAFTAIEDWAAAQELSDRWDASSLHRKLDEFSDRYCPILKQIEESYPGAWMKRNTPPTSCFGGRWTCKPFMGN